MYFKEPVMGNRRSIYEKMLGYVGQKIDKYVELAYGDIYIPTEAELSETPIELKDVMPEEKHVYPIKEVIVNKDNSIVRDLLLIYSKMKWLWIPRLFSVSNVLDAIAQDNDDKFITEILDANGVKSYLYTKKVHDNHLQIYAGYKRAGSKGVKLMSVFTNNAKSLLVFYPRLDMFSKEILQHFAEKYGKNYVDNDNRRGVVARSATCDTYISDDFQIEDGIVII